MVALCAHTARSLMQTGASGSHEKMEQALSLSLAPPLIGLRLVLISVSRALSSICCSCCPPSPNPADWLNVWGVAVDWGCHSKSNSHVETHLVASRSELDPGNWEGEGQME